MKRFYIYLTILILAGVCLGASFTTGWGGIKTAQTYSQRFSSFSVNSLALANRGTNLIYALVNVTTNQFDTRQDAGTTIPIGGGMTYTFNADSQTAITAVLIESTNGTSEVYLGGF